MVTTMDPDETRTQKYLLTRAMSILSPEAGKIFRPCLSDLQSRRKEKKNHDNTYTKHSLWAKNIGIIREEL